MTTKNIRTYSELIKLPTFNERFAYLKLTGQVGKDTFGWDRYLNQNLYRSAEWKHIRDIVIVRDNGCDLGVPETPITGKIIIHHMNPIDKNDILNHTEFLMDPEYVIATSDTTHRAIHYGDESMLKVFEPMLRQPNDQCPWR